MKKKDLIITVIYILFLIGPSFLYFFAKDKVDNSNYENRELYQKPNLSVNMLSEYPKNYENYFNDNLPFKNQIRKVRARILYKFLSVPSTERVIIGKNKWLFYNGGAAGDADSISDFRKTNSYTNNELLNIKKVLVNSKRKLDKKDIEFYILVLPNKENVYSDYIPKIITRKNRKNTKTETMINYLKEETDLNIIYPKDQLILGRKKAETYYKYDTHWNKYGAYLGVKELMKNIDKNLKLGQEKIEYEDFSGDLASMNLMSNLINKEPKVNLYPEVKVNCEDTNILKNCISNAKNKETIMVVGDSFREATIDYLSKIYKNSIFMHVNNYDKDFINKYKPDVVVLLTVERYSSVLGVDII